MSSEETSNRKAEDYVALFFAGMVRDGVEPQEIVTALIAAATRLVGPYHYPHLSGV